MFRVELIYSFTEISTPCQLVLSVAKQYVYNFVAMIYLD